MLRTIKVYGSLAKFLGQRVFHAVVKTPIEAVSFLRSNFPGLPAHMAEHDYKVLLGTLELQAGSNGEQLAYPVGEFESISIVPVIGGAGGRGTGYIIAGVVIAGLSLGIGAIASAGTAALGGFAGIGTVGTAFLGIGASLILSGVSQMLTPVPKTPDIDGEGDPRSNPISFSGIQNVSRQGVPVPVVYGETLVGSVVISSGINTQDD